MVVPLRARGCDEVAAVCLAVPFVHEYRLGIRTTDLDRAATRAAFRERFSALYSELVDAAVRRFPGVPVVATGHLTLGGGAKREDYPHEIHQVGNIDGLPVDILDARVTYTALGHIHRCYPVHGDSAWYSGTPVPYSLPEMAVPRRVLLVNLSPELVVQPVDVPRVRDLVKLSGSPEEVVHQLESLRWSTPLPPLVYVWVCSKLADPGLQNRLHKAVESHPEGCRPALIDIKQLTDPVEDKLMELNTPRLDQLRPEDVFGLMCDASGLDGALREGLESAFGSLASATDDTFEAMLVDVPLHTVNNVDPAGELLT